MSAWWQHLSGISIPLLLVVLAAVAFAIWYYFRPRDEFEAYSGKDGRVLITRKAIRQVIQNCCENLKEVGRARARLRIRDGNLETIVELEIRPGARLENITGRLQEEIGAVLRENLSIANVGEINVLVTGVLPEGDFSS